MRMHARSATAYDRVSAALVWFLKGSVFLAYLKVLGAVSARVEACEQPQENTHASLLRVARLSWEVRSLRR